MSATSIPTRPLVMRVGISDRKTGRKSARPSCTALRTLAPMKKAMCRKRCSRPGATYGALPSVMRWTISLPRRCAPCSTSASTSLPGSPAPEPMRMRRPGGIVRMASSGEEIFQLKRSFQSVLIPIRM